MSSQTQSLPVMGTLLCSLSFSHNTDMVPRLPPGQMGQCAAHPIPDFPALQGTVGCPVSASLIQKWVPQGQATEDWLEAAPGPKETRAARANVPPPGARGFWGQAGVPQKADMGQVLPGLPPRESEAPSD